MKYAGLISGPPDLSSRKGFSRGPGEIVSVKQLPNMKRKNESRSISQDEIK